MAQSKDHRTDRHGRYVEILFDARQARQYLRKEVSDRFYGKKQTVRAVFSSVNEAGMNPEKMEKLLAVNTRPSGWRIGEYIAITAMERFFEADIFHDPNRETTSPNASLAGPDLVGIAKIKDKTVFLLGEVKTSSLAESPPRVVHNLTTELENLNTNWNERAKTAIRWMLLHRDEYDTDAICKALKNYPDRQIAGVLVRDTEPNIKDMLEAYTKLLAGLSEGVFLLMVALYMPIKIKDFEKFMVA